MELIKRTERTSKPAGFVLSSSTSPAIITFELVPIKEHVPPIIAAKLKGINKYDAKIKNSEEKQNKKWRIKKRKCKNLGYDIEQPNFR